VATDYGYGLAVGERDGRRVIEHGGGINGFSSHLAWYPDDTLTVVVLANTQEATAGVLARDLARVALGVSDPEGRDLPVTRDDIARYRGTYDLGLLALRVFEANGSLNAQGTNQPAFRLLSQGNHAFVAEFDRSVRIEFHVTNGRATALTLYQAGRATRAERVEGGR
jgi:CubicO group peptidase (beta-lactamase class C family)